jgi:hypothetical protein
MIDTADPDIDLVHDKVAEAIDRAEGDAPAGGDRATKRKRKSSAMTGGSLGSLSEGYAANEASDLGTAC